MEENKDGLETQTKNSMSSGIFVGLVVVVVIFGGVLFLFQNDLGFIDKKIAVNQVVQGVKITAQELQKTATLTPSSTQAVNNGSISDEEVKIVNVEAGSFYYKPNEIKVKKGEGVKIVMTAADAMHDFNIEELDVSIPITKAGDTSSVEFIVNKTGVFEYYCSIGNHRKMGQVGKLIVEE